MRRFAHAWRELDAERRLAAVAAIALLVTMFFPWYGLQSLNRKTGAIYSHSISAFGDVSFVEAAIFLVAAGVAAMLLARAEGREFHMPGGDGTIVLIAGGWAALLIFYRVFSRPSGGGYPVGIEWGFFLAFVAAGLLAYAGWRMRAGESPAPPLTRARAARRTGGPPDPGAAARAGTGAGVADESAPRPARRPAAEGEGDPEAAVTAARGPVRHRRSAPVAARGRFPPPPPPAAGQSGSEPEQLSFEEPPSGRAED
ncbi:MAG TPA: hypothetical protein VII01_12605 [Solirubrobacteraceae bacterium]|jgi:hypothetical protein